MEHQVDINEMISSAIKENIRSFVDKEYQERKYKEQLIPIRTRYEAYGKLAEGIVTVNTAMDALKSGMKDCLKSLTGTDMTFTQSAEQTYSGCLDVLIAAAEMAVQTLNCIYKMEDVIAENQPPLVEMAEGDEPLENIDDEDLPENEEEE